MIDLKVKRDWFSTVSLILYELIIFFALALSLDHIGDGAAFPYAVQAEWLLGAAGLIVLLLLFSCLWGVLNLSARLGKYRKTAAVLEWLIAVLLLAAGTALRLSSIHANPVEPAGDFKTFYDIGSMLSLGSLNVLSPFYCDYIALFPTTMGYAKQLAALFSITDASVSAAQYLNLVFQAASLFVLWRAARALSSRIGGLIALAAVSFWPSMILFSSFIASEFSYTFFVLLGVWLVVAQEKIPLDAKRSFRHFFLLLAAGAAFGVAANLYPLAFLYVAAPIIYFRRYERKLAPRPLNEIPLGHRAVSKGWKCSVILFAAFFAVVSISRYSVQYDIDRSPAGPFSSLGYSTMVGLNQESEGAWNQPDADFLAEKQEETASAAETQLRCLDIAKQRLNVPSVSLINLFAQKLDHLLGRDEYAASLSIFVQNEQGTLNAEEQNRLEQAMGLSNVYFMLILLFAGIGGLLAYFRRPSFTYGLMLMFDGTVIAYMLLECQNRYHYVLLPMLAVMAGVTVQETMRLCAARMLKIKLEKEQARQEKADREKKILEIELQEKELNRLRAKALHAQFDMGKAIREGHIRVIASQAMGSKPSSAGSGGTAAKSAPPAKPQEKQDEGSAPHE